MLEWGDKSKKCSNINPEANAGKGMTLESQTTGNGHPISSILWQLAGHKKRRRSLVAS